MMCCDHISPTFNGRQQQTASNTGRWQLLLVIIGFAVAVIWLFRTSSVDGRP